jgi:hypothetical protein
MVNVEISALANTSQVFAGVGAAGSARRRRRGRIRARQLLEMALES